MLSYIYKIRKYQENFKTLQNYCLVFSHPLKMKVLSVLVKIS